MDWQIELMNAKYHLSVSKRLFANYSQFSEKRFLVSLIDEMARATGNVIRAYLYYSNKKRFKDFVNIVSKQYLDKVTRENLLKTLEVQKAQKRTPVQFAAKDKIIMLIEGKYRFLTVKRLEEFLNSVEKAILGFPEKFRQV